MVILPEAKMLAVDIADGIRGIGMAQELWITFRGVGLPTGAGHLGRWSRGHMTCQMTLITMS